LGGGLNNATISQKCLLPLIDLASTTGSVKGSTKKVIIVKTWTASPINGGGGFHPLHEGRCALRFKASAVAMM
jgi:hypothetical protein